MSSNKFRIVEITQGNHSHFVIEKRGWFLWSTVMDEGPDTLGLWFVSPHKFSSSDEAYEFIETNLMQPIKKVVKIVGLKS